MRELLSVTVQRAAGWENGLVIRLLLNRRRHSL